VPRRSVVGARLRVGLIRQREIVLTAAADAAFIAAANDDAAAFRSG